MTLKDVMDGLKNPKTGYKKTNPNYNAKTLMETADFLEKFYEANASTEDGLKSYREATGLKTKGKTENAIALRLKQISEATNEGLESYVSKHAEPIANEIGEQRRSTIAYKFSPEENSKIEGPKYYMDAVKIVNKEKDIEKAIQTKPEDHVKAEITAAPDYMKGIVGRHPNEVCKVDIESARRNAFKAIAKTGAEKYIAKTHQGQTKLKTTYETELQKIATDEAEIIKEMPAHFDAEEKAQYLAKINERIEKLEKTKTDFATLPELTNTLFSEATAAIKNQAA